MKREPKSPKIDDPRKRFAELSRRSEKRVRQLIHARLDGVLRRRIDTEDVLQEVLLESSQLFIKKDGPSCMKDSGFVPWIGKIVEHKIQNLRRFYAAQRRSVAREVALEDHPGSPVATSRTPSVDLSEREQSERIQEALARLSPREREVIDLVHFKKMRVADAARALGKTANATSVLLHQALQRLGRWLKRKER